MEKQLGVSVLPRPLSLTQKSLEVCLCPICKEAHPCVSPFSFLESSFPFHPLSFSCPLPWVALMPSTFAGVLSSICIFRDQEVAGPPDHPAQYLKAQQILFCSPWSPTDPPWVQNTSCRPCALHREGSNEEYVRAKLHLLKWTDAFSSHCFKYVHGVFCGWLSLLY